MQIAKYYFRNLVCVSYMLRVRDMFFSLLTPVYRIVFYAHFMEYCHHSPMFVKR